MFELMDDISELVYVADPDTYELLYLNNAGKDYFGVGELNGQKCYQVLQGLNVPCPFCTNSHLKKDQNYTWEFTNPVVKRHYLLKDRLIDWNGKDARLEIAFDITKKEIEKIELKNALEAEKMTMDCVRRLYQGSDLGEAICETLRQLGEFLSAQRAYIFEINGNTMSNTFEWCAPGVMPEIENLQQMDTMLLTRWVTFFNKQECVIIENMEDIRDISPDEYSILKAQGITSLVAAPLESKGKLIGYIGVDNPPVDKIKNITPLLHTLRYFLMVSIRRNEDEQLLKKLSFFDTLTGLYNRNRYIRDINNTKRLGKNIGIVYLDINGLKDINDKFGHQYGDQVLKQCAQKIKKVFGDSLFYRIGGDEFVVLCSDISKDAFYKKAENVKLLFEKEEQCRAAIGYEWSACAEDIQMMISSADMKMYEDKKHFYHKNQISKRYRHQNDDILGLADPEELKQKIKDNKFIVYFQTKISLDDRRPIGAEALVRYQITKDSIVLPKDFLPFLEDSKQICHIDYFVFDFVCKKIKHWLDMGRPPIPVSVNFSKLTLAKPGFLDHLKSTCEKYNVPKKWLEIELTETIEEMKNLDIKTLITEIRESGFKVSIDDFGTHYANLSLFFSVDFDVIKIDRSLVKDIAKNEKAQAVIAALADVCKKTGIRIIAEGIETEEQFHALRKIGIGEAQGFLFGKPMPIPEFECRFMD